MKLLDNMISSNKKGLWFETFIAMAMATILILPIICWLVIQELVVFELIVED